METSKITKTAFVDAKTVARLLKTRRKARIGPQTTMQCGVCWHVYDPAVGDEEANVLPGTPFLALPADWTCPRCGAAPERFLVADDVRD